MNKKKFCIYDNPNTMCREAYRDGYKVAFVVAELVMTDLFFQGWGTWESGQIKGDKDAMLNAER